MVVIVRATLYGREAGARVASSVLYLDLTVLPEGTFLDAVRRAQGWFSNTPANEVLTVDVGAAPIAGRLSHAHTLFLRKPGERIIAE